VIVRAIIGLGRGLGLTITAEGIETNGQLEDLKANGCIEGQGYLFGRAMPPDEVRHLIGKVDVGAACGSGGQHRASSQQNRRSPGADRRPFDAPGHR
jgi:predicted signal transduction protein with EAL and GGDEF domain